MDIEVLKLKYYDYSKHIRGMSTDTIRRYKGTIDFFCRAQSISNMDQVTHDCALEFFYNGRMYRKWSPNSFATYFETLTVFFRWCRSHGYMQGDPLEGIELPKKEKRIRPKLTKQNAFRVLEVAYNYPYRSKFTRYRNHAIFATFLYAGLRRKELLQLRVTDVDIENLTIFVRQGKGAKDRVVPMSFTLAQSLKRYVESRHQYKKTCPEFFVSAKKNIGLTYYSLEYIVDKLSIAAGFKFRPHQLRHTFATLMLEGGCDIYSLSRMMGHNDLKTTSIYLSASAEHLRSQIAKHPLN